MENRDFGKFVGKLQGFIDAQLDFVEWKYRNDPQRRSFLPMYLWFYFAIFIEELAAGGSCIAFWALHECLRRSYARITRPKYYPRENARRRALAAERRRVRRRTTLNRPPTAEALRAQFAKVRRNPEEMIRFGSMLCDLEAYVDNSLVRDETGTIRGRMPGIRGWLAEHCPEMHARYKTVIRYKALAEKFRQAVGLADPHPASEALGDVTDAARRRAAGNDAECGENAARNAGGTCSATGAGETGGGAVAYECTAESAKNETTVRKSHKSVFYGASDRATEEARMVLDEAGVSEAGLIAALDRRLDPDWILDSREMRENHIRKTMLA